MTKALREDVATLNEIATHWHGYELPQRKRLWAIAERLSAALDGQKRCVWREDWDGYWNTDCDHAFVLEADTPTENDMNFCCYCGGELITARLPVPPEAKP